MCCNSSGLKEQQPFWACTFLIEDNKSLEKAWMRVLDYTPFAKFLHRPISLNGNRAILYI